MVSGKKVIFAVDDEPEVLELLQATIERLGYEFRGACNADDAYKQIDSDPLPDLILVDIMMPGTDGIELCRRIKANPRTKKVPVLVVTSLSDSRTIQESYSKGAQGFLAKPFDPESLRLKIERALTQA